MRKYDVIIIGAGVAGLSTAYFLAKKSRLSVAVLEQETKLGGHASGRNAGMLRQAVSDPALAELAAKSRRYFVRAAKMGWRGLSFDATGSLLLAKERDRDELRSIARSLRRHRIPFQRLGPAEAARKVPLLRGGDFDEALFCPGDASLDIEALLSGFLYNLKALGVPVLTGRKLDSVEAAQDGFVLAGRREKYAARMLVNAAGAWAGWVADRAGAQNLPLMAYRRHLYWTKSIVHSPWTMDHRLWTGFRKWPFVWDLSHDLYFRPSGSGLLLSPCDKTPESRGDRREKTDPAIKERMREKLRAFAGRLSNVRLSRARSGLRTMTPDGRFVIGEDGLRKGFFWVAGLGGHGVTTCFSVGELAADIILGKKKETAIFSPKRFMMESVHAA